MSGSESGRSLVEMLGTLAIMGILTIGGIAGFNYAMNKQRANATVNYVNQLAVLGTGQMLAGGTPKLLDYPDHTPSGYPVAIITEDAKPNIFYVDIDQVPAPVCYDIMDRQSGWKMVNDIGTYSPESQPLCGTETVKMWFEIKATAGQLESDSHCNTADDCKSRFVNNYMYSDHYICTQHHTCELACNIGYSTTPVGCCRDDLVFNGGCCRYGSVRDGKCCQSYSVLAEAGGLEQRESCCAPGWFAAPSGVCLSCDDPRSVNMVTYSARPEICLICPQRSIAGYYCLAPDQKCDEGAELRNGACVCPLDKPVLSRDGHCHSCDYDPPDIAKLGLWAVPAGLGNRDLDGENSWGPYCNRRNGGGYSFPCEKGTIGVSKEQTYPTPDGQATAQYRECIPCAQVDISRLKYQAWCESCGGKWVGKAWDKGTCHTP